jgi:hypothetical protein
MKKILCLTILLASFTHSAYAQKLRLSTVQQEFGAVADVPNYVAILVEGASAASTKLAIAEGPGQVAFDKTSQRWLWNWRPSIADTGRIYTVHVRGPKSSNHVRFTVRPKAFIVDRYLNDQRRGLFYSGIPSSFRAKQPGLDGEYRITLTFGDSVIAQIDEPTLSVRPDMHNSVGKAARLIVEYTAPLTEQKVTLAEYKGKVSYPPFRIVPSMEVVAGEPIFFKAAMGLPPNFYTTTPGRFLIVKSDGYFEDTAQMIMGWVSLDNDPFSMFATTIKVDSGQSKWLGFDFGLRPTEKAMQITDRRGKIIDVEVFDPITKQTSLIEVRIFPRETKPE